MTQYRTARLAQVFEETTETIGGDTVMVCVPAQPSEHPTLLVYSHGRGMLANSVDNTMARIRDMAIENGWYVVSPYGGGDSWGNAACQAIFAAIEDYADTHWAIEHTLLYGTSMGGGALAIAYATDVFPTARGMVSVDGALSLAAAYAGSHTASIKTAYGIAVDGSNYASKTAGHDPLLRTASDYDGARFRFYASTADTSIPRPDHADPFIAHVAGHATVSQLVGTTVGHLDPTSYRPDDARLFFEDCMRDEGLTFTRHMYRTPLVWVGWRWESRPAKVPRADTMSPTRMMLFGPKN